MPKKTSSVNGTRDIFCCKHIDDTGILTKQRTLFTASTGFEKAANFEYSDKQPSFPVQIYDKCIW